MHCPQCGQQQISPDTKFCSRCGFQLAVVADLLAHGGTLPQLAELNAGKRALLTRKNGLIFSALWFIFFVMMLPAFLDTAGFNRLPGMSAVFGVFTTIMMLIISLASLPKNARYSELLQGTAKNAELYGSPNFPELGASTSIPAQAYAPPAGGWRAPDTDGLATPASVTEPTTKLLQKDKQ